MKVKFLEEVIIQDRIAVSKGSIFEAEEFGDYIYIDLLDSGVAKAPKNEIDGILEMME